MGGTFSGCTSLLEVLNRSPGAGEGGTDYLFLGLSNARELRSSSRRYLRHRHEHADISPKNCSTISRIVLKSGA